MPYTEGAGEAMELTVTRELDARVRLISLRSTPLSVDETLEAVADPKAGAQALFVGTVRDHDEGRDVEALSYSTHPQASAVLWDVARRVAGEHDVIAVAAAHRVGDLEVGDVAVVVAVSAVHRAEALEACRRLIDDLKAQVPIWKQQRYSDGASSWVGVDVVADAGVDVGVDVGPTDPGPAPTLVT